MCVCVYCLPGPHRSGSEKMMKHAEVFEENMKRKHLKSCRNRQKHVEGIEETRWLQSEDANANRSGRKINRAQD